MRQPTPEQLERLSRAYVAERFAGAQLAGAQCRHTEAMAELAQALGAVLYGDLTDGQGAQTTVGTVDGEEPPGSGSAPGRRPAHHQEGQEGP